MYHKYQSVLAVVLGFSVAALCIASAPFAAESESAKAIEKRRDPSKYHRPELSAQMTLGGAKYFVVGPLLRIESNYYYVRDEESGDEVRLVTDEGTRVICSLQTASGPSGDCAFKPGDRVKAEVSDLGTVTTIRTMPSEEKTADREIERHLLENILNIASAAKGDYVIVPVPVGSLREVEAQKPMPVKNQEEKVLGTLHKLIMDSGTGRIEYAVVRLTETDMLVPVPWADFTMTKQDGGFTLNTKYHYLQPPVTPKEVLDRSPKLQELYRLVQNLQESMPLDLVDESQRQKQKEQERKRVASLNCPDAEKAKGDVVRGQVVDVQENFLIMKDSSGKRIHVHRDQCTRQLSYRLRSGMFLPGDTIEAYITPKGHAISLETLRPASFMITPDA